MKKEIITYQLYARPFLLFLQRLLKSKYICYVYSPETYSEPCQTSKMELLAKIVNALKLLFTFAKTSILDPKQGSEYAYVAIGNSFASYSAFESAHPSCFVRNDF